MTDADLLSRPDSIKGRLQRAVLACLREEHEATGMLPTNGQFVWYEVLQRGFVPKHEDRGRRRTPKQDVASALLWLREVGLVPWEWIVDETCTLSQWRYADTVADFLLDSVERARLDLWQGKKPPLILSESKSLGGVLRDTAGEYLVSIAPTGGQCRGFLITEVAPILEEGDLVLYLGDWDHQGHQIEANSRRVLEGIVGPLDWRRIAITEEQVEEHDLPVIMKPDHRYKPVRYHEAVETEALGQRLIVQLVREALDDLLPEPLEDVLVHEDEQRAHWRRKLEEDQ